MTQPGDESKLRAMLRLAQAVTARHDLEDVLTETFRSLRRMVDFGGGSIQLLDDDGWMRVVACDPVVSTDTLDQRLPLGGSVASRVVLTERPVYVRDVSSDDDVLVRSVQTCSDDVRTYFAVPLLADGRAIGVLQADDPRPDAFDDDDRLMLVAAAAIVAAAIQNARAHARTATVRAKVNSVEQRLEQVRRLVAQSRRTGHPALGSREVDQLLDDLDQAAGESPGDIDLRLAPRVAT